MSANADEDHGGRMSGRVAARLGGAPAAPGKIITYPTATQRRTRVLTLREESGIA